MNIPSWHVTVKRAEFAKALRTVGRASKEVRSATAVITFDETHLAIELSGSVAQVAATGDWPSELRLPGVLLERLAKSLPENDPLPLKVEGERFSVAGFSIPCEWRLYSRAVSTPVRELIPANPDTFDLLMMAARCTKEEIDSAGASVLVANAQRKLDDVCTKAATYVGTHGVSPLHLRRLCEEHAAEGTRQFRDCDARMVSAIAEAWCILAPMGVEPMEIKALMEKCLRNAWK
jgi:hypothetical protein